MARPQHWYEQPDLLIANHKKVRKSRSSHIMESRTYLQMAHSVPMTHGTGAISTEIIDSKGLRELGVATLAEACYGAQSQICVALEAVVAPVGGTAEQQQSCGALGQLITGILDGVGFKRIATAMTFEGMLCTESHAVWEIDPKSKNLTCTQLDPLETFLSRDRTRASTCRSMSRRWVKAHYGNASKEVAEVIDRLPTYKMDHVVGAEHAGAFDDDDQIAWYEAWIAPCGDLPGRHTVQLTKDCVLIDEPWIHPVPPLVSSRWTEGLRGPSDGKPLGRTVAPFMAWEMEMTYKMFDSLAGAVPWVVGPAGAKMPTDVPHQKIDSDEGERIKVEFPPGVSADVRQHAIDLRERALRSVNVSETANEVAPQFKSGLALARWQQIINQKLSAQHAIYAQLWTDSGRIITMLGKDTYKDKPVNARKAIGSSIIEQITWPNLPEENYSLSFSVVSALGETIPQRLENLNTVKDLGFIDLPEMMLHLDVPDFRAAVEEANGPRAYIAFQVGQAINKGVIEPPMEMQDHAALMKKASNVWQMSRARKARPDRQNMEALRILWRQARAWTQAVAPVAPANDTAAATPIPSDPLAV